VEHRSLFIAVFCASVLNATPMLEAQGEQHRQFVLDWDASDRCLSRSEAHDAVERMVARSVFVDDVPHTLRVRFEPVANRWLAHVEVLAHGESQGIRTLESTARTCESLSEPVILVIALLVDTPEEERPLRVPHREDVWIGASLQAVGTAGATGDIAFGAGLGLWIDVGEATIELRVSTQFAELSLDPGALRFVASDSSLAGCWMPFRAGVLSLGACALVTGTLLYTEALRLDEARAVWSPQLGLAGALRAALALDRHVIVRLLVGFGWTAIRDRFVATTEPEPTLLYQPAPVHGLITLGVGFGGPV
jgi:hypothetical protein